MGFKKCQYFGEEDIIFVETPKILWNNFLIIVIRNITNVFIYGKSRFPAGFHGIPREGERHETFSGSNLYPYS